MPRTNLDKYAPKAPPLDPAWGSVLVRQRQLGMDMKAIAETTGYHYDTIRAAFAQPPIEWSPAMRDAILTALGLKARLVIEEAEAGR